MPNDVEDTGKSLIINIPDSKTKRSRSFVVSEAFYPICKKYMDLRPSVDNTKNLPFFLNYQTGKCTKQCVGINKLGSVPQKIAQFLGLPDSKLYTGHCFRRSSATVFVDAGGNLLELKKLGGWQSSAVAEGYIDNAMHSKIATSDKITSAIISNASDNSRNNVDLTDTVATGNNTHDSITLTTHCITQEQSTTLEANKTVTASVNNKDSCPIFNNCNVTINNYY